MKALSVTQPWASVICAGMKDVENRLWQAAEAPGRILIHATKTKVPGYFEAQPDDYVSAIKNARLMGWLPEYADMPYGSIIGYVNCYKIVRDADSFWAQPDSFHWCVKDAWLFDEPIPDIKGVRGHLFDVDIDENSLPSAHQVDLPIPKREGTHLIMPASNAVIANVENGAPEVVYDLMCINYGLYFDENDELIETKTIDFIGKDKTVSKKVVAVEPFAYGGPDGDEDIHYPGFDGADCIWSGIAIVLK